MHRKRQEKAGKIREKEYIHNTTPILKINLQVIKRGTVTIINGRQIILTEKTNKIQIGHIEMIWSVGIRADEIRDHLFGMREIAQRFPCSLGIIIAFPMNQVF